MRISDWSSDVCSSDLAIAKLTFEVPDFARFPALNLARQALQTGGAAPTILNAANEVAVDAFLKGRIGFLDITRIVEQTLARLTSGPLDDLEAVRAADGEAKIGRASCRERGCQYVEISVVAGSLKKKTQHELQQVTSTHTT